MDTTRSEAVEIDGALRAATPKLNAYTPASAYADVPTPTRLADGGYYVWVDRAAPSNASGWKVGHGRTPTEAHRSAMYWANQAPWARCTPAGRTPRWVIEQYERVG